MLSVEGEPALMYLISKLEQNKIKHSVFKEPDIGNQITSIAIEPGTKSQKICSGLPLALKEYRSENKINKITFKKLSANEID